MVSEKVILWDLGGVIADKQRTGGETISFLKQQGIPQGLITTVSGMEWQKRLRDVNVSISNFQSITDADDFARHYCAPKPAASAFALALSRTARDIWNFEQSNFTYAVLIEDTLEHISAANKLGFTVVQMVTQAQPVSLHAHFVVKPDAHPITAVSAALRRTYRLR